MSSQKRYTRGMILKIFSKNKKLLLVGIGGSALLLFGGLTLWALQPPEIEEPVAEIVEEPESMPEPSTKEESEQVEEETTTLPDASPDPEPEPEASKWPVVYSLNKAAELTVVVNKKHRLPSSYTPSLSAVEGGQLRPEAASALKKLMKAADDDGAPMVVLSSYRSYATQQSTYQYWVNTQGQAEADRGSARPGHSEHQTGLAVDMGNPDGTCRLLACFGEGKAGKWLEKNAHDYGFIIRYEEGKESLTGYIYEPWHLRYLGVDTAKEVVTSGQTLDQYYDVPAGDYQ